MNETPHQEAMSYIEDLTDEVAEPIIMLAKLTLVYIEEMGLVLTQSVSLGQRIYGLAEGENLGLEFSFTLHYAGGQRKLSMRNPDGWMLVVEELNNETGEVVRELTTMPFCAQDFTDVLQNSRSKFKVDTLAAYDS